MRSFYRWHRDGAQRLWKRRRYGYPGGVVDITAIVFKAPDPMSTWLWIVYQTDARGDQFKVIEGHELFQAKAKDAAERAMDAEAGRQQKALEAS